MLRRIYMILMLLAAQIVPASIAQAAAGVTWKGNGHTYQAIYVPTGLSWTQAFMRVRMRGCGWYLATITSKAENDFVFGLMAGHPEFFMYGIFGPWLGAFQTNSTKEPAGNWRWVTEEKFVYTNWSAGSPNDISGSYPDFAPGIDAGDPEGFLQFFSSNTWNDLNVNALPRGYIAEFDAAHKKSCTP